MTKAPTKLLPILFVFLLMAFSGCSVLGVGAATITGKVTISWLVRTDPQINPWEYRTVSEFEASHPNIHVQIVLAPPSQYYDQKQETMEVGFEPADVFTVWGSNSWADDVYRQFAADLTPYIQASHFSLAGMDQKLLQTYSINNHVYALPFGSGGSYLFYNVDMFKQAHLPLPPTNWDDPNWNWDTVLKDAKALTVASKSVETLRYGLNDDLWPENANVWLFGGDIFPSASYSSGVVNAVQATSPAAVQAEQWKQDLIYKYKVMPTPADATTLSGFLSGKVGMDMNGVWGFWQYPLANFHWAAAPLPHIKTNKDVIFTDAWMMSKDSRHPQQAWQFIQWLSDPAHGAKTYMETSGEPSAWSQLLPEWATIAHKNMPSMTVPQLEELIQGSIEHGQESVNHMVVDYGEYDTTISNVMASAFGSNKPVPATLDNLQKQLDAIIKKAGPLKPLR